MGKIKITLEELKEVVKSSAKKVIAENARTKKKYINRIYKNAGELTSHLFSDENWQGVSLVVDAIKGTEGITDAGAWPENGGYRSSADGLSHWKEYTVEAETELGDTIHGTLNCHAAGSVEDPFSKYDMSLVLY